MRAIFSNSSREAPMTHAPSMIAIVAGVAPFARMTPSTSSAHSMFAGYGMPCATMVLSSATTGSPRSSAARTRSPSTSTGERAGDDDAGAASRGGARTWRASARMRSNGANGMRQSLTRDIRRQPWTTTRRPTTRRHDDRHRDG